VCTIKCQSYNNGNKGTTKDNQANVEDDDESSKWTDSHFDHDQDVAGAMRGLSSKTIDIPIYSHTADNTGSRTTHI
jgi:hypothetical protein